MKIIPNLGPKARLGYVVVGGILLIAGATSPYLSGVWAWLVGALGVIVIVEGAIGF
ncbi:MAG: hypothetical protein V3R29_10945 [Candidatus Acidoferrales bacterium]